MTAIDKYNTACKRLSNKIKMSQTPVPGLIMGLSGTDSVVAFQVCYEAAKDHGMEDRIQGVHYVKQGRKKPSWFESGVIPWLQETCPKAKIVVDSPMGGNHDQQRWADLHFRALNEVYFGGRSHELYEPGKGYWTVGTINATEKLLGTYSSLAKSVSVQPIHSLWKTEVLEICRELGVPEIAMEMARIPDCLCGRDELAAENIDLIDAILRHKAGIDFGKYDPDVLSRVFTYIGETIAMNDFKNRTPYWV